MMISVAAYGSVTYRVLVPNNKYTVPVFSDILLPWKDNGNDKMVAIISLFACATKALVNSIRITRVPLDRALTNISAGNHAFSGFFSAWI